MVLRYFFGRRIDNEDIRQINRWKAIKNIYAVKKNCTPLDLECRKKLQVCCMGMTLERFNFFLSWILVADFQYR